MVRTFTRNIVVHANLILLSPSQYNSDDDSNTSNDYVVKIIYDGLCKFVHVDLCEFIIAGSDVLEWNHRKIKLDGFYHQVFYPFTVLDGQEVDDSGDSRAEVSYSILISGTEMLVPAELSIIKEALAKFDQLINSIDLTTEFVKFTYKYEFENNDFKHKNEVFDEKILDSAPPPEDSEPSSYTHVEVDNKLSNRLSEIVIPFLLLPELDSYVGIYHRAPRILIHGDKNRNEFNKWIENLKFHLKFKFLPVSISHIFSCFCGDSEKNLTFAFDLAKSEMSMPTIMILDGIDLICRDNICDSDITNRLFATLLLQLDRLNEPVNSFHIRSSVRSLDCSDECHILKWINQCNRIKLDRCDGKILKANPVAVIGLTDVPIEQLSQAVTRKGRFDFFIN